MRRFAPRIARHVAAPFRFAGVAFGAVARLLAAQLGPRELALLAALALIARGAFLIYPPAGCLAPGLALLYLAIAGTR